MARPLTSRQVKKFQDTIWNFYYNHGRRFPWRDTKDPYKILVSEVMLQQTQTGRVVTYYERFIKRFPDVKTLSRAKFSSVYAVWQGLGYNRRALALWRVAGIITKEHHGRLPKSVEALEELPGIGSYTARAVGVFSWNFPVACIETNIRRVFIHEFFKQKNHITDKVILSLAEQTLDKKNSREWHWALMDYGAHLKTITENPNRKHRNYRVQAKFEGSSRQVRGALLKALNGGNFSASELANMLRFDEKKVTASLLILAKEGFVYFDENKKIFSLA